MRKIKDLREVKVGDWVIVKPKLLDEQSDKRKSLIIFDKGRKGNTQVFLYNANGSMEVKLKGTKNFMKRMIDYYGNSWEYFNLDEKEKTKYSKELVIDMLEK